VTYRVLFGPAALAVALTRGDTWLAFSLIAN
jgi:hypothetical protein